MKAHLRSQSGFTLIELMATIAILALIVVIAVPAIGSIMENAENDTKVADIEMFEKSAGIAYLAKAGANSSGTPTTYRASDLLAYGYLDIADDHPLVTSTATVKLDENSTGQFDIDTNSLPDAYKTAWDNR